MSRPTSAIIQRLAGAGLSYVLATRELLESERAALQGRMRELLAIDAACRKREAELHFAEQGLKIGMHVVLLDHPNRVIATVAEFIVLGCPCLYAVCGDGTKYTYTINMLDKLSIVGEQDEAGGGAK